MATPNMGLPTVPNGQTNLSIAFNQLAQMLDCVTQLSIIDILAIPPDTVVGDIGKSWIIDDAATGVWAGKDGQIALCSAEDLWIYFQPQDGWRAGSAGGIDYRYDEAGNDWIVQAPLTNPMTTPGDLIVGGVAGAPARLPIGVDGQILKLVAGAPAWTTGGDVAGPAVAVADRLVVFDGVSGKLIKDGGKTIAELLAPRVQNVVSAATVTPTFANDIVQVTAQAVALQFLNPTGTAIEGHPFLFRVKDDGTARALTFDTAYVGIGGALPTTTVAGKWMYFSGFFNDADDTVHIVLPAAVQP